ncbi:uncharacterized protein LOC120087700 [Benincasa hispida]|uniref:uncharacterized protein LOC120087700 n=1 Tax=Benincasa hispida TaxID=102211 RepID=UPI0018FF7F93|nr:uncharacterized protein LOC120087700 [Benincasa hispida]XP_038900494.1 uncharacterized protein LOC120087700 [Benincasa hispida]XP_038900495.1 uncharacterized protein LOC120087700 [Benincasa hispida]
MRWVQLPHPFKGCNREAVEFEAPQFYIFVAFSLPLLIPSFHFLLFPTITNQFYSQIQSLYEILLSPNMFNFEDELIIEPGFSWLIWIQLLVILLIFILCCLTIFAIDFSKTNTTDINSTAAIASSSTTRFLSHNGKNIHPNHNIGIDPNPPRNAQVTNEQSIRGEITSSTSRRITQVGEGTVVGGEGSQETKLDLHPCSYFRLAKSAFLRCLGLDASTENSVSDERQRQESRKFKES